MRARLLWNVALLFTLAVWLRDPGDGWPQGRSLEEAVTHMTVADGLDVKLVAGEPLIRQPVALDFDDRGRLWVIQYLQYPNPAGLKRVKVDRFSRTVYDRVPEPPPRGPRGADRITILEEKNGKLVGKDFLSDLNLATGMAFGHGGVYVLQTPYLLFYPDRDRDDIPDGDPDVLLSGFGMEDAHSVANSLTWGPDGWLYGCQGSTVTANIRGLEFQQGVWRFHPLTRQFELFCEGGGNSWGLDFDRHGNLFYSTNHGGFHMLHGVQGAYYWKQFGKHGALHNPHAYGYFDHVPHRNFRGGHVTVGGIIYQGAAFPRRFRDKYFAADLLGHNVYWHDLDSQGSTFRSSHGGNLLLSHDTWFAPSDVASGPEGAVYVADWHDARTAHPDPDAQWDRGNGRVYRIEARGTRPLEPFDLAKFKSSELMGLLGHPNDWFARKARRVLADRRDPEVIFPLRTLVLESKDEALALQALWALQVSGGFDESFAARLLDHRNPHVRRWTVRLLGDEGKVSSALARRLAELAVTESEALVRSQLASTAKRLPASAGLPIAHRLLLHGEDASDAHIPLLLWWAVEHHAVTARGQVLEWFATTGAFAVPLIRATILERLMRRYAAEGTAAGLAACAQLLEAAPSAAERQRMLAALDLGCQEGPRSQRKHPGIPPRLEKLLAGLWTDDTEDPTLIGLLARLGRPAAQDRALALACAPRTPLETRTALFQVLGDVGKPACVAPLLRLLAAMPAPADAVHLAVLDTLQRFDDDTIADALLQSYSGMNARLRTRSCAVLLSRKRWALKFLQAIDQGKFLAKEIAVEQLRPISLHQDRQLDDLVRKHWGNIQGGTPEAKLAEVRRLANDLRAGSGAAVAGRALFVKHCASCHRLFEDGSNVGPDLTHANRKDRDYLLVSIVDPSALIRKEFLGYDVQTRDGRLLTGLIAEQTPASITLVNAKNERLKIARDKIETIEESLVSLMPENLLKDLTPQELRDLFRYLQLEQGPTGRQP